MGSRGTTHDTAYEISWDTTESYGSFHDMSWRTVGQPMRCHGRGHDTVHGLAHELNAIQGTTRIMGSLTACHGKICALAHDPVHGLSQESAHGIPRCPMASHSVP